jgi:hypothetical protein
MSCDNACSRSPYPVCVQSSDAVGCQSQPFADADGHHSVDSTPKHQCYPLDDRSVHACGTCRLQHIGNSRCASSISWTDRSWKASADQLLFTCAASSVRAASASASAPCSSTFCADSAATCVCIIKVCEQHPGNAAGSVSFVVLGFNPGQRTVKATGCSDSIMMKSLTLN